MLPLYLDVPLAPSYTIPQTRVRCAAERRADPGLGVLASALVQVADVHPPAVTGRFGSRVAVRQRLQAAKNGLSGWPDRTAGQVRERPFDAKVTRQIPSHNRWSFCRSWTPAATPACNEHPAALANQWKTNENPMYEKHRADRLFTAQWNGWTGKSGAAPTVTVRLRARPGSSRSS